MEFKQKQDIQAIYEDPKFKSVMALAEKVLEKWEQGNTVGDSDFETLRLAFQKEYKVKGLIEFFHLLYAMAYNQDEKFKQAEDANRLEPEA